jgi:cytochrome P450
MGGIFTPVAAVAGVACLAYVFGVIIYRLYFHPLSKYPGPFLNKITPIPSIISLLNGRLAFDYKVYHDKYGPIVRVTPTELSFNSAGSWEDIYGHRQGLPNLHKDPIHVGSVDPIPGVATLTMADDATHSRQRRALAYAFSQKALNDQEPLVNDYVDTLIEKLGIRAKNGQAINLVDWLNFTTFDIIGDLAFNEPFGCLKDEYFHDWVSMIFESIKVGAIEQATRRIAEAGGPLQTWLLNRIPSHLRALRRAHLERSREKVLRRLENKETDHRDFIWYILQQQKRHNLKQDEIVVNGALFIVAGSETTANALSGTIARLLWNPDKYKIFIEELRSSFETEKDITNDKLMLLPYFNAVVEEGLRIHPPAPVGFLRTVPKGGAYIDGEFIPEGISVATTHWASSHNADNFKDPDTFIPERWLEDDPKYASDKKLGMRPFSLGPRGCIGKMNVVS